MNWGCCRFEEFVACTLPWPAGIFHRHHTASTISSISKLAQWLRGDPGGEDSFISPKSAAFRCTDPGVAEMTSAQDFRVLSNVVFHKTVGKVNNTLRYRKITGIQVLLMGPWMHDRFLLEYLHNRRPHHMRNGLTWHWCREKLRVRRYGQPHPWPELCRAHFLQAWLTGSGVGGSPQHSRAVSSLYLVPQIALSQPKPGQLLILDRTTGRLLSVSHN